MSGSSPREAEVAVVGGGPAGALTAALLAGLGHEVTLFERAPRWRWRSCGVFASPASITALRRLGVDEGNLEALAQPVAAMEVRSSRGSSFALTYGGTGSLSDSAVGFDRGGLDPFLLARAAAAGVTVSVGATVGQVALDGRRPSLTVTEGGRQRVVWARVVIGADGIRSTVARAAGVVRAAPIGRRAALTFHIADPGLGMMARMVVIDDGYVGLAPIPGGRVNVGIVLGRSWADALRRDGGPAVAADVLAAALQRSVRDGDPPVGDAARAPLDRVAGVSPLAHAVARRAGASWLLVGDAAGFLDPFTGEGLHRAIRSAELAAETTHRVLAGTAGARLDGYDSAMRRGFAAKDVVSRIVQAFLDRPALFDYAARRLGGREQIRATMALVMGDLVPASRALDPRFLAALLRP